MNETVIKSIGRISRGSIENIILHLFNKMRQKRLTTLFADEPYYIHLKLSDIFINAVALDKDSVVLGKISNLSIENNEGHMQLNFKSVYDIFNPNQKFNDLEKLEEYKMHFYAARNEHSYSGYVFNSQYDGWSTNAPISSLDKAVIFDALYSIYKSI